MFKKYKLFLENYIDKKMKKNFINTSTIMIIIYSLILLPFFGYSNLNLEILDFIIEFLSSNFIIFASIIISSFIVVLSYNRKEYLLENEEIVISFKVFLFLTYFLVFSSLILKFVGREIFPNFIQLFFISIFVSAFLQAFFLFWIFLFSLTDMILPQKIILKKLKEKKIDDTILNILKYTIKNNDDNLLELICKEINNYFTKETKNKLAKRKLVKLINEINNFYNRSHKYNYLYGNEFLGEIIFRYKFIFYKKIIVRYDFKEDIFFQHGFPSENLNFDSINHIVELNNIGWLKLKKYYEKEIISLLDFLTHNYNYSNFKFWFRRYISFFNPEKYSNSYSLDFLDISFEKIIININRYYTNKDSVDFLNSFNIFNNFYIRYISMLKKEEVFNNNQIFFHLRLIDKIKEFLYSIIKKKEITKYEIESFSNTISFLTEISNIIPNNTLQFNFPFLLIELRNYLDENKNEINNYEYLSSICFSSYEDILYNVLEEKNLDKLRSIVLSLKKINKDKYFKLYRDLVFNAYIDFLTGKLNYYSSPLNCIRDFIELFNTKKEVIDIIKKIPELNFKRTKRDNIILIINNNNTLK